MAIFCSWLCYGLIRSSLQTIEFISLIVGIVLGIFFLQGISMIIYAFVEKQMVYTGDE